MISKTAGAALLWGAALSAPAYAHMACPAGMEPVVDCPVSDKNALLLCMGPGQAAYFFGPPARPDLVLFRVLDATSVTPWPGVGSNWWEETRLTNAGIDYVIWQSKSRNDPDDPARAGVTVLQGDTTLARLECQAGDAGVSFFAMSDAMSEGGWCWNFDQGIWDRNCAK